MSTIKSSAEDLTLNADGSGNDIKFQSNAVEKASLSDAGLLTTSGGASLDGAVTINETGADVDFRVEASGQERAIVVNGATGYVGINTTGMATAPLHVLKTAGTNEIVPLLVLDSNIDSGANGKGGSIVFQETSSYANTAEITAARVGGGNASEVNFKLRDTSVFKLRSSGGRAISQFTANAWCAFNAQTSVIRDSHNVSSLGDVGTGRFYVYIDEDLANADSAAVASASNANNTYNLNAGTAVQVTTAVYVMCWGDQTGTSHAPVDPSFVSMVVFGD